MVLNTEWAQVEVIDLFNDGSGLAFGIIGGRSTGVVVKTILPGGVADRDGRLQSGDHILQIGEVNLRGLGSEQVAAVLRQCGVHVRMIVARPIDSSPDYIRTTAGHASIVPTKILGDPLELDRHLAENGYGETMIIPTTDNNSVYPTQYIYNRNSDVRLPITAGLVDVVRNPLPIGPSPLVPPPKLDLPETEIYTVELQKDDDLGLGITVAGYVCETTEISGIFVKSISEGSAAHMTSRIKIHDRIVAVDGVSVVNVSNHRAVELLRNSGPSVVITFERYLRGPKFERLQQAIKADETTKSKHGQHTPPSQSYSSLIQVPISSIPINFFDIDPEGDSRTSLDFDSAILLDADETKEIVIDQPKSIDPYADDDDNIVRRWREKVVASTNCEIIVARIEKEKASGLGISLEGTVDIENGKEVRPHHYIRNILAGGPLGRVGLLKSGDELLEVNGIELIGLNHIEVVMILKQLVERVCLVCARYEDVSTLRIIDTAQERDAFQARNILAGSLRTLIPSTNNERLVKAKSETSLISNGSIHKIQNRSRSCESLNGLPMWDEERPCVVDLYKTDYGLGFSILDYQDPLNVGQTMILVRSLVPGGTAQIDGHLAPGDRLLRVNNVDVSRATLDFAVKTLKNVGKGLVRLTVLKPLKDDDDDENRTNKNKLLSNLYEKWQEELENLKLSEDEDDDPTCVEDFQECIEEYQECIEMPSILIDDRLPTNRPAQPKTNSLSISSEKDGYETCVDDSLSDELSGQHRRRHHLRLESLQYHSPPVRQLHLDTRPTYDCHSLQDVDDDLDEFFLVEYPAEGVKCASEPIGLQMYGSRTHESNLHHRNDNNRYFNSVLDIVDRAFVTLTYDPGPEITPQTPIVAENAFLPDLSATRTMLEKRWGATRAVDVDRRAYGTSSVGISIVGGRVDLIGERTDDENAKTSLTGIFVKEVIPDSPAGCTGQFAVGDRILEVSGVDLRNATHENAVDAIRNATDPIHFVVQSLMPPWNNRNDQDIVDEKIEKVDPLIEVERKVLIEDVAPDEGEKIDEPTKKETEEIIEETEKIIEETVISNDLNEVPNDNKICEKVDEENAKNIDTSIESKPISEKAESENDDEMKSVESPADAMPSNEFERSKSADDDEDEDEDEDEEDGRDMEGRTTTAKGQQIDRASAGNLKRNKEEIDGDPEEEDDFGYTTNKVKKKYSNLGDTILLVQLERGNQGLGLSLAGHKDRNCMAVFVCGLNPNGAAFKAGAIQVGDEILEVNGIVLHGRCHLNASAIIKGLSGPIFKVVILRRQTAINDIAVKPITQFPVSLEEAFEEQFSANYPNVRSIAIKKGSQSLGIMIIEGKHAEIGQGIFISDIQEGSSAEKAGLEIGEMILAVNKDSLIGSNYESAANLLKRTEGLVTLVVSNPVRKERKAELNSNRTSPSLSAAPLTPTTPIIESNNVPNAIPRPPSVAKTAPAPTAALRPTTPVPTAVPAEDPATCAITPGCDVAIEIVTDNRGLGVFFVGGKDTPTAGGGGVVIVEVFAGGAAERDARLRAGDQIIEANGTCLKDATRCGVGQALRQTLPKMKLIVFRPEKINGDVIEVDLVKKIGKGLGLSVVAKKNGKGCYVTDVMHGGTADVDGRIGVGDLLTSVNGINIENMTGEEVGAIMKTVTGRISLKLYRYKPIPR